MGEIGEDGQVVKMGEMEIKKGKRRKKKKNVDQTAGGAVTTTKLDKSDQKKMTMAEYSKAMRKRTLEKRDKVVEKEDAKEEARSEKSAKKSKSPKRAAAADSEEKWDW